MAATEWSAHARSIWAAAIRDAASVFSAYLTPLGYSLGSFAVRGLPSSESSLSEEVAARLDLGRAQRVAELLEELDTEVTSAYRHEIVYSRGIIRGKPHIPLYLLLLARGELRGVPVLLAQRQPSTPENLFVSEVVRVSRLVCASWMQRTSAERELATELSEQFAQFESRAPWSSLRGHSRAGLSELSSMVLGRVVAGAIRPDGAVARLQNLFPPFQDELNSFESFQDALSLMACDDPEFEDRVFELVVLAWILRSLAEIAVDFRQDLGRLKSADGKAVAIASLQDSTVEVFFQSAASVLPPGNWKYRHSGNSLRAIPDIIVRSRAQGDERIVIVDAKNRSRKSESEVAYKLLGYKENLRLRPYTAVGVYPSFESHPQLRRLSDGEASATLAHIPLSQGYRAVKRIFRAFAN